MEYIWVYASAPKSTGVTSKLDHDFSFSWRQENGDPFVSGPSWEPFHRTLTDDYFLYGLRRPASRAGGFGGILRLQFYGKVTGSHPTEENELVFKFDKDIVIPMFMSSTVRGAVHQRGILLDESHPAGEVKVLTIDRPFLVIMGTPFGPLDVMDEIDRLQDEYQPEETLMVTVGPPAPDLYHFPKFLKQQTRLSNGDLAAPSLKGVITKQQPGGWQVFSIPQNEQHEPIRSLTLATRLSSLFSPKLATDDQDFFSEPAEGETIPYTFSRSLEVDTSTSQLTLFSEKRDDGTEISVPVFTIWNDHVWEDVQTPLEPHQVNKR